MKTTSAEVIGVPSENRAAGSRWKTTLSALRIGFDAFCDKAVERERLVGGARHQRLIDVADKPLRGRQRLDVVGVQAVEGAEIGEVQPAALGRVRIDVGQMVEVRRQAQARHASRSRRPAGRPRPPAPAPRQGRSQARRRGGCESSSGSSSRFYHRRPGGFAMEGAPGPDVTLFTGRFAGEGWLKGGNCYWNVVVECGKRARQLPQRVRGVSGHEAARRVADADPGRQLTLYGAVRSAARFRLTVRKDD